MRVLIHAMLLFFIISLLVSDSYCEEGTDSERVAELEAYQRAYIAVVVVLGTLLTLSLLFICCPCIMLLFHTFLFFFLFIFIAARYISSFFRRRNVVTPTRISSEERDLVQFGEHLSSIEYFYLRSILRNLNLESYIQTFLDDEINFESIILLNKEEIEDIFDENVLHRKIFEDYVKKCKKTLKKDTPSKEKRMTMLTESEQMKLETLSSASSIEKDEENEKKNRRSSSLKKKPSRKSSSSSLPTKKKKGSNNTETKSTSNGYTGSRSTNSKLSTANFSDLESAHSLFVETESIDLERYVEENEKTSLNGVDSQPTRSNDVIPPRKHTEEVVFSPTSSDTDSGDNSSRHCTEDEDDDDDDDEGSAPFCCIPQKSEFNKDLIVKRGEIVNSGSYGRIETAYLDLGDEKLIRVAIKTIKLKKKNSEKKVRKEVEIMKQVKHPNLLNCFGCYRSEGNHYIHIVMEYCEKGDLYSLKTKMSEREKLSTLAQIVEGMIYLHGSNIVHRDLKTQNIVLSRGGVAKICDFGASRCIFETGKRLVGTPEYIAPEVYKPSIAPVGFMKKYGDMASKLHDIYGFGIIVWEVIVEEQPFLSTRKDCKNNQFELLRTIHTKTLRPSLKKVPRDVPGKRTFELLKDLMVKCWQVNPEDRIQSFSKIKRKFFTQDTLGSLYSISSNCKED